MSVLPTPCPIRLPRAEADWFDAFSSLSAAKRINRLRRRRAKYKANKLKRLLKSAYDRARYLKRKGWTQADFAKELGKMLCGN